MILERQCKQKGANVLDTMIREQRVAGRHGNTSLTLSQISNEGRNLTRPQ